MSFVPNGGRRAKKSHRSWCLNWPCRRKPIVQETPNQTIKQACKEHTIFEETIIPTHRQMGIVDTENGSSVDAAANNRSTTVDIPNASDPPQTKRISFPNLAESVRRTNHPKRQRRTQLNSVSKIDRASRVCFPLVFFLINVFYWYSYLTKSQRWASQSMIVRQ